MEWSCSFGWADIIQIVILVFAVYAAFSANKNVAKSINFSANRQMIDSFFDRLCLMCKSQFLSKEEREKTQVEIYGLSVRMIACVKNEEAQKEIKDFFSLINSKNDLFQKAKTEEDFQQIYASEQYKAIDKVIEIELLGLYALLEKELLGKKEIRKKIKTLKKTEPLNNDEKELVSLYRLADVAVRAKTLQVLSQKRRNQEQARRYSIGSGHLKKQDCSKENPVEQKEF